MHEGIPILNFLVPKEFTARERQAHRRDVREGRRPSTTPRAAASWCRPASRTSIFACDDVLVAVGQENAFPWIERDVGIEFDKWGMPKVDPVTMQSTNPKVFFGGDAAFGPKNIIWAVAHGHEAAISIDKFCRGEDIDRPAAAGGRRHQPEDGHPRVELRQRHRARPALQGAAARQGGGAASDIKAEVELGFDPQLALRGGAALPQLRRPDGVHAPRSASSATPASTSARWTASPSRRTARKPTCARGCSAPAQQPRRRTSTSRDGLKTGRVMVKDEDVCLHCGLCAERCPTGAWDMQKFSSR